MSSQLTNQSSSSELPIVPTMVLWNTQLTRALRFKFFLTGFIIPVICLLLVCLTEVGPSMDTPWQSGQLEQYIGVLLNSPPILVLLPLIGFSMVCLGVWCRRPESSQSFFIRLGIGTGAILAFVFAVLSVFPAGPLTFISAVIVGPSIALIIWFLQWILKRSKRFTILHLIILTTVFAVLFAVIPFVWKLDDVLSTIFIWSILGVASAPALAAFTYARVLVAARHISRQTAAKTKPAVVIGAWLFWLTSFMASWKLAVDLMMIEYSKLPTTDPNCFVSSAAANGHRRLVCSQIETAFAGPVNLQMRRLKFLEFCLAAACPGAHRWIRSKYNWLGPPLADQCCKSEWLADAAFLMLKPVEWTAVALQNILDISPARIQDIYRR